MVETGSRLPRKPPQSDLVPAEPIRQLILWWKSQNPYRNNLHLDLKIGTEGKRKIGFVDDLFYTDKGKKRQWIKFDHADDILVAIERTDAWFSTDLQPYYEMVIFPEDTKESPSPGKRLNESDRAEIKRRYRNEHSIKLSKEFGVSSRTIRRIANGK